MKKILIVAVLAGIVVGGSVIFGMLLPKKPASTKAAGPVKAFSDAKVGIELKYPEKLQAPAVSDEDKKAGFVMRLAGNEPPVLITVRTESGLKVAAAVTKTSITDMLVGNLVRAYPKRFPEFKMVNKRSLTVDSRPAAEVMFTYKGTTGETAKQRLLIVSKDDDTALYVAGQAKASEFDAVNKQFIEPVMSSVGFQ